MTDARALYEWLRDVEALVDRSTPVDPSYDTRGRALVGLDPTVSALLDAFAEPAEQRRTAWLNAVEAYEELRAQRRRDGVERLPSVKPTNLGRSAFHVAMAVGGVLLYELLLGRAAMIALCGGVVATYAGLEVARRRSPAFNQRLFSGSFGALSRPGERNDIPGGAWFVLGALLGAILLPQRAIEIGILVLGFGDPAASLAGKRWGRRRIVGDRTLVGTLAFLAASTVAVAVFTAVAVPSPTVLLVMAPAAVGAAAELTSGPLDDNLVVSLVAGAVAAAVGVT